MKDQLPNAVWGVLDYAAYPVSMLAAAPALLHTLGTAQYGVWIVCTAAISTGAIIASGFGDANIQHVASKRALQPIENDRHSERSRTASPSCVVEEPRDPLSTTAPKTISTTDPGAPLMTASPSWVGSSHKRATAPAHSSITTAVRNMLGINLTLGLTCTAIALTLTPFLAHHVGNHSATPLALAALLILLRAIESVCISTQRAYERYGHAIALSVLVRIGTIVAAVALTHLGLGVTSIMLFTLLATALGTVAQLAQLKRLIAAPTLTPRFDREAFRALFGFGIFSWLQAISTILFTQADRLLLAATLGAAAVTSYALCVQIAQPIYGLSAAALHFLFPYLAARATRDSAKPILTAFLLNLVYTTLAAGTLFLFGDTLLRHWLGADIANAAQPILAPIVLSFALLSLSVPAYYALLAFARIRAITAITLTGGLALLLVLTHAATLGMQDIAYARVLYALVALGMYAPLFRALRAQHQPTSQPLAQEAA